MKSFNRVIDALKWVAENNPQTSFDCKINWIGDKDICVIFFNPIKGLWDYKFVKAQ